MIGLIPKLPLYWSFRAFGWPRVKPFSVVISVSFRCNSKCRTCDVWRKPNDDLSVDEWDRVFASLAHASRGLATSGLAGEAVATAIAGETAPVDEGLAVAWGPGRFDGRRRG